MQFIIATGNAHKLTELERILNPLGIDAASTKSLGVSLDDVEETGTTFEENAYLKAKAACDKTGLPAVADDSGLCVNALNGAPGVYSARYAGENATDKERYEKLLKEMEGITDRTAYFVSAVCCVWPNGDTLTVRGECHGTIGFEPLGEGGFGYDPIFMVGEQSYSQMTPAEKDAISHRGRALVKLQAELKAKLGE
ncbi:MAG: RdgB/HAM1 family non-canonical purine NTP pyrophosphatase [Clostridia bacterium]|nr:RdgB/HAM1 family non-canonical purine NTP pyrophosphatase [Clostridia bacterium]